MGHHLRIGALIGPSRNALPALGRSRRKPAWRLGGMGNATPPRRSTGNGPAGRPALPAGFRPRGAAAGVRSRCSRYHAGSTRRILDPGRGPERRGVESSQAMDRFDRRSLAGPVRNIIPAFGRRFCRDRERPYPRARDHRINPVVGQPEWQRRPLQEPGPECRGAGHLRRSQVKSCLARTLAAVRGAHLSRSVDPRDRSGARMRPDRAR